MPFDPLVSNAGRLRILASLAAEPVQPFVRLRAATGLTDGNLATHARRLASGGLVVIEKSIADGKPLTTLHLTSTGRAALAAHAQALLAALREVAAPGVEPSATAPQRSNVGYPTDAMDDAADDWVD